MPGRSLALDGFRGVAILLVLLHHAYALPGGWAGVDLFFALSGYLITRVLLEERQEPNFWRIFYLRRVSRILPAYLLLLAATVAAGWFPTFAWPYFAFFAANLAAYRFDFLLGPLGAVWSLAVEEHFYFLWPSFVRNLSKTALIRTLVAILLAEPLLRILAERFLHLPWKAYYYLTPFRLDGLAAGSLAALLLTVPAARARVERWLPVVSTTALAAVALCFGLLRPSRMSHIFFFNAFGYSAIAATSALVLCWLTLQPQARPSRLLSAAPLRFLGRISYGAYLYHPAVLMAAHKLADRSGKPHYRIASTGALAVTLAIAWASFRFIESPILARAHRHIRTARPTLSSNSRQA